MSDAADSLPRFADLGLEPAGNSPQQYAAFIKSEIDQVAKIAKAYGTNPLPVDLRAKIASQS
jgi:tripartite-type tricarboxylate transporter receptor subunit TctC